MLKNTFKDKNNIKYFVVGGSVALTIIVMLILNVIQNKEGKVIVNGTNILKVLEKDKIGVYIDGEVNNQGFVQIPKGKNLEYALNKLGGVTKNADINSIDLKQVLKNGEKIFIPGKQTDIENEELEQNIKDKQQSDKVNINIASVEELKTLEGIGEKTANNIIEYREEKQFSSIEEIMEVKGIGEGKYEKIKEDICV